MSSILIELGIIFLLLLANGTFAMAEIAVVSARKGRLRQLADGGDSRARLALMLAESPNTFLATVQIGITLVGVLAAAFSGATLAEKLAASMRGIAWIEPYEEELALVIVVVVLTYVTLVVGELVPKRLGLGNPEGVARALAGPMRKLSLIGAPLVSLLGWSTDGLLGILRIRPVPEVTVTEEEVKLLVREGMRAGVLHPSEPAMIEAVMALDRVPVRDLMTPRAKIVWINVREDHDAFSRKIVVSGHTTFPVYEENRDHVVGVVSVKSIYASLTANDAVNVRDLMKPALVVPASRSASSLLERFKETGEHVALVTDEFGSITGIVSLHDIMEAILGELPSPGQRARPQAVRHDDGSWLVDGMLDADEFERTVDGFALHPRGARGARGARDYETFAGFILKQLGHVPHEGERFELHGFEVRVIDMDGHRVDKVLLTPLAAGGRASPVATA